MRIAFAAVLAIGSVLPAAAIAQTAARPARTTVPAGKVEAHTVFDSSYGRPRNVWVYTPPGYEMRATGGYPLIVAFDGADYQDTMPLPAVLDSLLAARKAPAFVAVLIDNGEGATRIADLGNAKRMADFLSRQLVPWVRRSWRVTSDPQRVIVTGSSAGGLASAYVALVHPELFGNVWSQSGAFWRGAEASNSAPYEWLTQQVAAWPRKPVHFALDVGALEAKGYELTYTEVPGGNHAPQWWRLRLADGIVLLAANWNSR